jgi:Ser/Thr protein kinase RdoA (MazF antagonist)
VAIDWDAAAPGTRLWDLAQAAHAFAPLARAGVDPEVSARRLARFADGYGLTAAEREEFVPLLAVRSERMYEYLDHMRVTGQSPWSDLWERGVGKVWQADAQWIREHDDTWRGALLPQR